MIDLSAELATALRSPDVARALAEKLAPAIAEIVATVLAAQAKPELEPLSSILGCTPAAARMRVGRNKKLAALALRIGKRSLYRRSEVLALLSEGE